jgi:hypothetical protein
VRPAAVGQVFRDQAVTAAQFEHALRRAEASHLQQQVDLFQAGKAVLAQVLTEDALAKNTVGRAVLGGGVKGIVKILRE